MGSAAYEHGLLWRRWDQTVEAAPQASRGRLDVGDTLPATGVREPNHPFGLDRYTNSDGLPGGAEVRRTGLRIPLTEIAQASEAARELWSRYCIQKYQELAKNRPLTYMLAWTPRGRRKFFDP
jgi:hypothetical protein